MKYLKDGKVGLIEMLYMQNKKVFLVLSLILCALLITTTLCACQKDDFAPMQNVLLHVDNRNSFDLGEFKIVSNEYNYPADIYEVLPKDKESFIKFLQNSQYYMGDYKIDEECSFLDRNSKYGVLRGGETCMWFTANDSVWMGKYYANKFYYFTYVDTARFVRDNFRLEVTKAIFANDNNPNELGEEYDCAVTWEQLKTIFSTHKIDEENYSIEFICDIINKDSYIPSHGKTLMYYNKDRNTLMISEEYVLVD